MTLAETIRTLKNGTLQISKPAVGLVLSGSDALTWLQGQITQDISRLRESDHISTCLCNAKGQLLTTAQIYLHQEKLTVITPHPEILVDRVSNFVIMEDVEISEPHTELYSIQGITASGTFAHDRTGYSGFDTLTNPNLSEIPPEHLNALEIAAGIPRVGIDTGHKTLPPELGPHFEKQYISYTKGCYVGQEVLQRIHSRGHTNKTWIGLIADQPIPLTTVLFERNDVGSVHRTAEHPEFGFIASATLRNVATEPGTQVQIGEITATVKQMPLLG